VPCFAASLILAVTISASAEDPEDPASSTDLTQPESKSGYEDADAISGNSGVGAQLVEDDRVKDPLFPFSLLHDDFYKRKKWLKEKTGIEINIDYNFLNQYASFSTEDRRGASGALRFYGRWYPPWIGEKPNGSLVFRIEHRHQIGPQTPKELGFSTGSSLSTAGFKEFGWGATALYWAQRSDDERIAFAAGQMDAGDFEDIHPLLNPWTAFMSDASFNNPSTALPNQGLGLVIRGFVSDHLYLKGGVADANGTPNKIDFDSFFTVQEYFTWAEFGWAPTPAREAAGESIHLLAWHSDERVEAEVPEGWGLAFSAAREFDDKWIPFVRAGYSEGDAANLSAMVSLGAGWKVRPDDLVGAAVTWARPPQGEKGRDQYTVEAFYRLQLTHNLQLTPGFFWHLKPSYNPAKDSVWVASVLRIRLVL
jgi:porin